MVYLFISVMVIFFLVGFVISIYFLKLSTKILKWKVPTFWQGAKVIVLTSVMALLANLIIGLIGGDTILAYIVSAFSTLGIFYWLLSRYTKIKFWKSVAVYFIYTISSLILVMLLTASIRLFLFQPFVVDGDAMNPTVVNNDYLITDKITYKISSPKQGDIVILRPSDNPSVNYLKRIIGVPGDTVEIRDGEVFVNGQKLSESYTNGEKTRTVDNGGLKMTLRENEYFVMGDNRNHSRDSREIGAIPLKNIVSKVNIRLFPFESSGQL